MASVNRTAARQKRLHRLLRDAGNRVASKGIMTASHYLVGIRRCLGDSVCSDKYGGDATTWGKAIKDGMNRLVYRHPDMKTKAGVILDASGKAIRRFKADDDEDDDKDKKKSKAPKGSLMVFDCVATTTSEDRDNDILECGGATLDPKMPLLWQHIPMEPIGRMVEVLSQDDDEIQLRCAVANTRLGEDACVLIEFGALRISHGFRPTKFKERPNDADPDGPPKGWHIEEYEMLEVSVVSIPSNRDAEIIASEKGKLKHPLVKRWAATQRKLMPPLVKSGWDGGWAVPDEGKNDADRGGPGKGSKGGTGTGKDNMANKGDKTAGKKGAKLSKKDTSLLKEAYDLITQAHELKGTPVGAKAMLKQAASHLKTVCKDAAADEKNDDDKDDDEEEDKDDEEEEDDDKDDDDKDDEEEEERAGKSGKGKGKPKKAADVLKFAPANEVLAAAATLMEKGSKGVSASMVEMVKEAADEFDAGDDEDDDSE